METIEKAPVNNNAVEASNDVNRSRSNEDLFDDDITNIPKIGDRKQPGWDNADEDGVTLKDDDINGRDLDTDGGDEWDPGKVEELDRRDLEDDDQAIEDVHGIKNDQFGSLGRSINNEAEPDPNEIPEEGEANREDIDYPDDDRMEQAPDDEVTYREPSEVTAPEPAEAPERKVASLDEKLDPTFVDDTHQRQSKRMVDHEPGAGSTTGEHGAYNL